MKTATRELLDKALRAVHAAETLLRAGDTEFAAGRAYYAMFYAEDVEQMLSQAKEFVVQANRHLAAR